MKKKCTFSYLCFRVIRFLVWLFYPKMTVEGTENLPPDACIVVGNHTQMNGPICGELYFPGKRKIWCAHQMMYLKEVPAYAFEDFWSGKPKWTHPFYRLLSYIIAPIAACVFNNAYTTFKQTIAELENGGNVIIYPECYTPTTTSSISSRISLSMWQGSIISAPARRCPLCLCTLPRR